MKLIISIVWFSFLFFYRKTQQIKETNINIWEDNCGENHATFDISASDLMLEITGMALRKLAQQKCMVCKWERKEGITDEGVEEKLIKQ